VLYKRKCINITMKLCPLVSYFMIRILNTKTFLSILLALMMENLSDIQCLEVSQ